MWVFSRKVPPEAVEQAKALEVEAELPSLMKPLSIIYGDRRHAAERAHKWDIQALPFPTDVEKLGPLEPLFRRLERLERKFESGGVDADALVNLIHTTEKLAGVVDSARQKAEKDVSEVLGKAPSRGEASLSEISNDQNLRRMMASSREEEYILKTVLKSQKASGMKMKPFIESLDLRGREVDVNKLFK